MAKKVRRRVLPGPPGDYLTFSSSRDLPRPDEVPVGAYARIKGQWWVNRALRGWTLLTEVPERYR